ncbi:peptidoglycan endopeptidase [Auritidibacter sp. NML130574]|uniref:C40 family peptidase n=1 Tax=Auritidibacter sp. NML130574 TaxID=2170745 RepID=UPI000D73CA29|nr:C40 family peptidase [Auritidibacter sp. NML130574]AXR74315.1 peptidoglycan endopeptidase [Auritidibacter sp. NML130574]
MKSRRLIGVTASVAIVTATAVAAAAVPNMLDADASRQHDAADLPKVPSSQEIDQAKTSDANRDQMRQRLIDSILKTSERFADIEAAALEANENARSMSEAAAAARRDAEDARKAAENAAEQASDSEEAVGAAAGEMYRNGNGSASDLMLGDEDSLSQRSTAENLANRQAREGQEAVRQANEADSLLANAEAKEADAEQKAEEEARAQAEREEEARRYEEERQELDKLRSDLIKAWAELEGIPEEEAAERIDEIEEEEWAAELDRVLGQIDARETEQSSPASTQPAVEAEPTPVTEEPTPSETTEEPTPSATPSETPSSAPASPSPTQTSSAPASPSPTQSSSAPASPSPTQSSSAPSRSGSGSSSNGRASSSPSPTKSAPKKSPSKAPSKSPSTGTAGSSSSSGWASTAIQFAVGKANDPNTYYSWGGNGPQGYDCSGLTVAAFNAAGKSLPRSSKAQYAAAKQYVPLSQMQPGDLVFWSNNGSGSGVYHVAIYMGNNQIVHARNPQMGISVTALNYGGMHNILPQAGRY